MCNVYACVVVHVRASIMCAVCVQVYEVQELMCNVYACVVVHVRASIMCAVCV